MSIVLLHLSDIHIASALDPILKRTSEIAATAHAQEGIVDHACIVVTGDIAYSGLKSEYDLAEAFLKEIQDRIETEIGKRPSVILVPGNHDCDFENEDPIRMTTIGALTGAKPGPTSDRMVEECTAVQDKYFAFEDAFQQAGSTSGDRLWRTTRVELGAFTLAFERLNLSWVSKLKEEPGRIYFPIERYSGRLSLPASARIVMMHHPLNWLSPAAYRPLREFVRRLGDLVLTGHEHHINVGMVDDSESDVSYFVEGGALQLDKKELRDSCFSVLSIDLAAHKFRSIRYQWDGKRYSGSGADTWAQFRSFALKANSHFSVLPMFAETLDDPGPFFGPADDRAISLEDIFVYPTLRKQGSSPNENRSSAADLLNPDSLKSGVLLEGEEKTGRTSLLYRLYRIYRGKGFVPLLLRGQDIRRETENSLDTVIGKAVAEQYGEANIEALRQLPKGEKLLLIDNLDESRLRNPAALTKAVDYLMERFEYAVLTVGALFEVRSLVEAAPASRISAMKHFEIEEFGHVLRGKLVDRWLGATSGSALDPQTRLAKYDQIEKTMNQTMVRTIVPSVPIYLLVLLDSIDAERSSDLKDSALGYYYQSLLTDSLRKADVPADKLTEHFQYCSQLAWFFSEVASDEVSEGDAREFNERFCKRWHSVDFEKRIATLIRANILRRHGDDLEFRYRYIYFYFKGMYLSERVSDLAIRAEIARCCEHLYVRENANTILFLAHHTNDDYVLRTISDRLSGLFGNRLPIKLEGDTKGIEKLVENAPNLVYSRSPPEKNREAVNELRDEAGERGDGLAETEEPSATSLSLSAQLVTLSKTIEILGQILKTQYSKIERWRKQELIAELFNGPLRALSDFVEYMTLNSDLMAGMVEAAIQEEGEEIDGERKRSLAQTTVAMIVLGVAFGLIMRAAAAVNAQSLIDDIEGTCKTNHSVAFRMIELAVSLDSQKAIPRQKIRVLHKDTADDPVASRLLQWLIMYRLFMFRTEERDMQWLADELKFDLGIQHRIAYSQSASTRMLK